MTQRTDEGFKEQTSSSGQPRHEWTFVAASTGAAGDADPVLIAVCALCGEIRAEAVRSEVTGQRIDLVGRCPGATRIVREHPTPRILG